jgi:chemotaxis protein methyltransferase CheR
MTTAIDYEYLRTVVMRNSGNQVDPSRDYLFESRLQGLLRNRGLDSLAQLVSALRADSGTVLQRSVAEAMTINETSFFRDTPTFDYLREQLLPAIIENRRDTRSLRFWSAASSSGQEAYSLAMMMREHFPPSRRLETRNLRHRHLCGDDRTLQRRPLSAHRNQPRPPRPLSGQIPRPHRR